MTAADEALRAELLRRVQLDQDARLAEDEDRYMALDAENLPWLRELIAERGWPGSSLVGTDGAHALWLLVQHATGDIAFMRRCLDLMTAAVEAGEASRRELGYLTDRVLLFEGGQQVYGTQLAARGGKWVPDNLRDPGTVDKRRAAVGMAPLAEYLAGFTQPATARLQCLDCHAMTTFEPPEEDDTVTVTCSGCGRERTITGPPPGHLPGGAMRFKCPACGAWGSFELPAAGEQVTMTCPRCGETTTATFNG